MTIPTGVAGDCERAYRLSVDQDGRVIAALNVNSGLLEWYAWTGSAWERTATPDTPPVDSMEPPQPAPPHVSSARTSTHWVLGTASGDIYTRPV
jgi:hypothetical protein